jgi:putative Ca2+/H+ antiporter (TMEM165/GDT1 family)
MALTDDTNNEEGSIHALLSSFMIIIFSEIGDKTFLIAAILAMRHPRLVVFGGAFGSLMIMSLLSAQLGHLVPTLLPRKATELAAAILFFVFGAKMLKEASEMKAGNEKIQEEMKEAEEEIEGDDAKLDTGGVEVIPLEAIEEGGGRRNGGGGGRRASKSNSSSSAAGAARLLDGLRNFFSFFLGPVFVQAFVLTFLGEWGDRSQISTIALGAAHVSRICPNPSCFPSSCFMKSVYLVTIGTIVGHGLCTALAVLGGRYISTKISVKHSACVFFRLFLSNIY